MRRRPNLDHQLFKKGFEALLKRHEPSMFYTTYDDLVAAGSTLEAAEQVRDTESNKILVSNK